MTTWFDDTRSVPLDPEIDPPPHLKSRVERSLRARRLIASSAPSRWSKLIAVAAGLVLFAAGFGLGTATAGGESPQTVPDAGFMLLLFQDDGYQPGMPAPEVLGEYVEWTAAIRRGGLAIRGEALGDRAAVLSVDDFESPRTSTSPWQTAGAAETSYGQLVGFFLLATNDRAEALSIARTCPHLRFGGRIVVRPIQPT